VIVRTDSTPKLLVTAFVLLAAVTSLGGCKKKKPKPFPPAPQLSTAAVPVPVQSAPAAPTAPTAPTAQAAPAAPPDPLSPAERAALERAKPTIADLEVLVKKGVVTSPDKPDDVDATTKCTALDESRPQLEAAAGKDADAKKAAADIKRLCSFEVPILGADLALKQVTRSPSQASHKLMCGFAQKDIDKARRVNATDRRVRDLDVRYARSCR
jgi:predicted small lipoprotein YifL